MAKSTKSTFKPAKNLNYKSVVTMAEGGNVSELNYSERREYIEENYAPFITDAQMIFSIYDSGIEYDYKSNREEVISSIIESYKELGDYTETTLPQETIYEIQDWDLVRKEIDPETDEVISETPLEELSADNTYNFSYNGLVDLNWRVYHDEEYDRFFYVIMPHLGGDIRGNYGDAIILEGNDKEELFYRFYEGFISGGASIYIKFKDGSEIAFDSEQDSDVFYFRVSESFEPTGMAQKYLNDFEQFETWQGDEFLEETIDIYLARKGVAPKMMAGGSLNDETPMAYIQILGYDEGQWFNLTDYSDGQDVIDGIFDFMNELNNQFGGNREEFEVTDYEGFGDDLYDRYMGANEFEEIIEAYEKYESSDFPADVISAYKNDSGSGSNSLSDVIDEMDNNYFGKYDNLNDFGYEMVQQGVYEPSDNDVYITDTDKRIIAGEESDALVNEMSFEDLMNIAPDTESEYEDEKSELEDKIVELQEEIKDLTELQNSVDEDDEYETIAEQIEEKEIELEDAENSYVDIDSRFEDKAREEARDSVYDEIYDKLENDLSSWLEEYGYTSELQNLSFLSVDYENIGEYLSSDYLIVEFDGDMYFFNNYAKGGRITASKRKPKFAYYIVESSTKKLVSGYSTKAEANEQRKLLVQQYPSMRFEIYPLANLEAKTDLDVYAKKDYVELSTLDKIKKVSVDAYRYGQEKVGQAQMFLEKNDVKSKIKRGARKVYDKTKQGANWLRGKWLEADFGDGTGRAKFFADGGGVGRKPFVVSREGYVKVATGDFLTLVNDCVGYLMVKKEGVDRKVVKDEKVIQAGEKVRIDYMIGTSNYGYQVYATNKDGYQIQEPRTSFVENSLGRGGLWEVGTNERYADGGGVESEYKKGVVLVKSAKASNDNDVYDILNDKWKKYNIVNSRAFDLETPYNRGWIDEGISINVYLLKDTETNKYYWDSDYIEARKNKMAYGGVIEVVGKANKGAFRNRDYEGFTEKEVIQWWEERGYKLSKTKSESSLKPYTFYINKYADGGSTDEKYYRIYGNATKKGFDLYYFNNDNFEDYIGTYSTIELAREQAEKDGYDSSPMYYRYADGGRIEKVFVAQTDGILGIYSGSDAYSIEISKGDKFITFGNQDDNNWWYVKMLDDQPKTMMENNTFDYNKNKSRVNIKPNDLILTFPRGDKSIYAEMKEVFADGGYVYDIDGQEYIIDKGNYTNFKSGDMAYNPFSDIVQSIYFDKNDENADDEFYVNENYFKVKKINTKQTFADGGELYDMSLPMGFYVKINPHYTATIRNLKSFESYLERKDELFGKEFGEITNVDKSASQEWVAELNRLIEKKKSELENKGIGNYKVGDEITLWRNQADRDGYVLAVDDNEMLVEYEMPNGTSALNIIDLTLPEYDKYNYNKNYKTISYDNARKSKKWSGKIDANRLINNPQGSSRRKSPTKRFADGGEIKLSKKQKDEIKEHIADYYYNNELIDNYEEWEMDYMLEDKNGRIILKSGYAENDVMKKIIIYFELNNFSDIDLIDKEIQLYGDTILSDNYGDNDYDSVQDWQKNNFADGGMAGLGEVSGMLPNALPMSTITPMADGGKLADWKEGKFINGKKWYLYKYDNKRWVLEIYKKDDLIDSYYIDVEELENQETGIGKKIYISYSNSQGSGILIPEMVQVKVFNVIKMDNPKLYFGENVYDYQVAHNKFSEEFGYSNGGGVDKPLLKKLFEGNYENNLKESVLVIDNGNGTFQFYDEILGFNGDVKKTKQQAIRNLESYISKNYKVVNKYADGGSTDEKYYIIYNESGSYSKRDAVLYRDDLSEKDADKIAYELNKSRPSPTDENLYYVEKASDSRFNYGNINKRFLNSIDIQYKQNILRNIANHYGISIVDAEKEVTDVESELLEEYITDISLRRKVYSDRINRRYANGGGIEIAEIPTRERTTITKPTTTPTTTPSKPDKDSPYKPKGIPKPKATRM